MNAQLLMNCDSSILGVGQDSQLTLEQLRVRVNSIVNQEPLILGDSQLKVEGVHPRIDDFRFTNCRVRILFPIHKLQSAHPQPT